MSSPYSLGDGSSKMGSPAQAPLTHNSQASSTIGASQPSLTVTEASSAATILTESQEQPQSSLGSTVVSAGPSSSSQHQRLDSQADDATLMPPPTPGGSGGQYAGAARSSGRAIKPTLKVRGDSEEPLFNRVGSGSNTQGYGFRSRKSTQSSLGSNNARAPRLKLNLKDRHAMRGKGDPTLAGVNKTLPYMQGYDRELDSSDDETGEGLAFEEQIILRMPEGHDATKTLAEWVRKREVGNIGRDVEVKFKDSRRAIFKMGDKQFSSKLVDLPAIIESHKTLDNKQLFKIADISQMLLVTHQIQEESELTRADGLDKVEGLTDDFIYDHGITPPMKWARKRRFRKRIHKRTIETVEKEVERLLAEDERADNVEFAMIDLAEADLSDSDDEAAGGGRRGKDRRRGAGSLTGSQGETPSLAPDGASVMSDGEDEGYSQAGDGATASIMGAEDEDVDQDLQRELEEEMLLQQQEDEEDDDDDDASTVGGRRMLRSRSMSRATSDDDDDEDDEDDDEDDLFDAGDDEEAAGIPGDLGVEGEDDDDDDDMDEEEQERRVRETQLEAECKEIEAMVKRKHAEVEGTNNALLKQRNQQTLKRMQTELDMKKSQLLDLRQQRREGKEAAKAEAQAQAEQAAAFAVATAAAAAASTSAPPASKNVTPAPSTAPIAVAAAVQEGAPSNGAALPERGSEVSATEARKANSSPPKNSTADNSNRMDVDEEEEDEEDDDEENPEGGSDDGSDLFG